MKFRGHWKYAIRSSLPLVTTRRSNNLFGRPPWVGMLGSAPSRGAVRKSFVPVDQLPQGNLPPLEPTDIHGSGRTYPPTMQQHLDSMRKYPKCVVLTRVGDFYELYFDQVAEYAPLLNLKQAKKDTTVGPVPMAGFQYHSLDRYLKILVSDHGLDVALHDQVKPPEGSSNLWDRRVTRIITPGTLIDESFVDQLNNNYLLALHFDPEVMPLLGELDIVGGFTPALSSASVGLSWIDLSNGDFNTQQGDLPGLQSTVARIAPREVVLDAALGEVDSNVAAKLLGDVPFAIRFHQHTGRTLQPKDWSSMLEIPLAQEAVNALSDHEVKAAGLVLDYAQSHLLEDRVLLKRPVSRSNDEYMMIDKQSLRGLEIRATIRDGHIKGSLLHAIRETVTKGGTRLLASRIVSPSTSLAVINERLELVETLLNNDALRDDLRALLRRTSDTQRLLQRFSVGRGDADDLLGLADTIRTMSEISATIQESIRLSGATSDCLRNFVDRIELESPQKLAKTILGDIDRESVERRNAVDLEQETTAREMTNEIADAEALAKKTPQLARRGNRSRTTSPFSVGAGDIWIMRSKASIKLKEQHNELLSLLQQARGLEQDLGIRANGGGLELKWSSQHGFHCSLKPTKSFNINNIPEARVLVPRKTTTIISVASWSRLGDKIDATKLRIRREEEYVFGKLRAQVIENIMKLRRNAELVDELDVACSSALLAKARNFVRPILNNTKAHNIIGGRHPTVDVAVEGQHGRAFVANDCRVGNPSPIYFITGPNMGGKSTYLRQNALITIMAQTGLFVPATHAEIGLVDKIFSRVGSADNLYRDQSTFMVEMLETAEILKQATPRSFVVMDEIGRGTTPEAGIAVGYACLQHLHSVNQCRTLFATHFHALADMTQDFDGVAYHHTDVSVWGNEDEERWTYEHKLKEGVNRESHALRVARTAGMPDEAIKVAAEALRSLRNDISETAGDNGNQKATG